MGLFDWVKKKKDKQKQKVDDDKLLREEVMNEMSDEILAIRKEKIRQEILAEENGEKKKGGSEFLKKLGEEFKTSNLGGNIQMEKLLGKKNDNESNVNDKIINSDKISQLIGGKTNINIMDKNLADMMGYDKKLNNNPITDEKLKRFTNLGSNASEEKLKELLKRKVK